MMRGNVDTRLKKLEAGEADAILLAMSGLKRLGLDGRAAEAIDPFECPPAPGQGALALQTRSADVDAPWIAALRHEPTALAVAAERAAMEVLEGSCRTAIGAHARVDGGELELAVEALTADGKVRWRREGRIVSDGWILAGWCSSYEIGAEDYVVGPIATAPTERGRGLAHLCLVRAMNFCLRRGARWVYIDTTTDNLASRRTIEKSGMVLLNDAAVQ